MSEGDFWFDSHAIYYQVWQTRELVATADSEEVIIYDPDGGTSCFRLNKDNAEQFGKWLIEKAAEMKGKHDRD